MRNIIITLLLTTVLGVGLGSCAILEDFLGEGIGAAYDISGTGDGILEGISQWTRTGGEFFATGGASLTVGGAKLAAKLPTLIKTLRKLLSNPKMTAIVKVAQKGTGKGDEIVSATVNQSQAPRWTGAAGKMPTRTEHVFNKAMDDLIDAALSQGDEL